VIWTIDSRVWGAAWAAGAILSAAQPAHAEPGAAVCEGLARFAGPQLTISAAVLKPAGPADASTPMGPPALHRAGPLFPEHCMVRGTLLPRQGVGGKSYGMGFELRMPTQWNGRFLFQGGGGLDGFVGAAYGAVTPQGSTAAPALARGFAVVSTDSGHEGFDPSFAFDQQARLDFAYNALDKVTLEAKVLIAAYYGRGAEHSYFMGCSNGGRHAMMAAQRLPLYFDGIVAGDPGFDLSHAAIGEAWDTAQFLKIAPKDGSGHAILSRAFSEADLKLVADAVLARCDGLDGLKDGMINDLRACRFDPAELRCGRAGQTACLSAPQVSALHAIFAGARDSRGRQLYAGWPYDAGIGSSGWRQWKLGTSPTAQPNAANATLGAGALALYFTTPPDPGLNVSGFDFDRDSGRVEETATINDATGVMMSSFSARGGKLLIFEGVSDPVFSASDIMAWYDRVRAADPNAPAWTRLFLAPGMTHCGGGPSTDDFDPLTAVVDWVEEGKAPERLIARGVAFPGVSRPLCPYPQVARYADGDVKDERSFKCR
jgi:feruloyl esterase